jgi:AcrR family transcriptional regulator
VYYPVEHDLNMYNTRSEHEQGVAVMTDELDPKQRILQAVIALLGEAPDPETITVRQIARRADVGIGLINYHFGSKEALLNEAIGTLMREEAGLDAPALPADAGGAPVERMRTLLKQTTKVALRFPSLGRTLAKYALLGGDYGAERTLLPLLREHFGGALSEPEIRVTAIQIVAPLQVMAVRAEDVEVFAGLDLLDEAVADQVIDRLVDNVLK